MNTERGMFIVIEGLDAVGKTTLTRDLSVALGAKALRSPPHLIAPSFSEDDLRLHFDAQSPLMRRAYYRAANMIASEQARKEIKAGNNVVMDRYWMSTVAYSTLDSSEESGAVNTEYPPELLVPDIVILLTVNENERIMRMKGRGDPETAEENTISELKNRESVLRAYRQFKPSSVDTSDLDQYGTLEAVLTEISKMKETYNADDSGDGDSEDGDSEDGEQTSRAEQIALSASETGRNPVDTAGNGY